MNPRAAIFREGEGAGAGGSQQKAGGGGEGESQGEDQGWVDNFLPGPGDSNTDSEINLDPNNVLDDLFKVEDGGKDGEDDKGEDKTDSTPPSNRPTTEQVQEEIKNLLTGMRLPEDIIPENFNPADPGELRGLLTNVQRLTAQQTLGIVLRPVQHAMQVQMDAIDTMVSKKIKDVMDQSDNRSVLETEFPIVVSNPGVKSVVEMIFNQSKSRYKGDKRQAVAATRKALGAMGINYQGGESGGGNRIPTGGGGGATGVRTGASALDAFAPLPRRGVPGRMSR